MQWKKILLAQPAELIVYNLQKLSVCLSVCTLTRVAQIITAAHWDLYGDLDTRPRQFPRTSVIHFRAELSSQKIIREQHPDIFASENSPENHPQTTAHQEILTWHVPLRTFLLDVFQVKNWPPSENSPPEQFPGHLPLEDFSRTFSQDSFSIFQLDMTGDGCLSSLLLLLLLTWRAMAACRHCCYCYCWHDGRWLLVVTVVTVTVDMTGDGRLSSLLSLLLLTWRAVAACRHCCHCYYWHDRRWPLVVIVVTVTIVVVWL